MRDVYVLGVGMIKFGRYPDKDVPQLGAEAALVALKDAGLTIHDVEMLVCGNLFQANAMNAQRILQQIGQTGIPALNVANACATGSTAVREAYMGIASGMYEVTNRWAKWDSLVVGHAVAVKVSKGCWAVGSCPRCSVKLGSNTCVNTGPRRNSSPKCR
jgi:3-oxoacyl-[acyl-carrier-protein] synthase III